MSRIFISYRREDSAFQAHMLYDKLREQFGLIRESRAPGKSALVTLTLVLAPSTVAADRQSELQAKADAIRATAAEMRFKEIPWVTDLFEGVRLAKKENRPVFLYLITGDPLDDC